jgi:hypothetical protein
MFLHPARAVALVLTAVATTTLSACSQPSVPSCGVITQTSTTAVKPANAKFPLFSVHIELAAGVQPVTIYDTERHLDVGYPQGQKSIDTFMPAGTFVLHGFGPDGGKCQTGFQVK